MKLKREKYLPEIERRKFKKASAFRQSYLVINGQKTKIICNHINNDTSFNEYVKDINDIDSYCCYLIAPMIKVALTPEIFEVFDVLEIGNDMYIKAIYTNNSQIDDYEFYYDGILLLQKNLSEKINLLVGSKINFRRV